MTVEKLPPRRPFWQLQRERGNEGEKLKLTAIKLSHRCRTQAVRKPSTRAAWRGLEWRRTALVLRGRLFGSGATRNYGDALHITRSLMNGAWEICKASSHFPV